jgi:hypothetical protein
VEKSLTASVTSALDVLGLLAVATGLGLWVSNVEWGRGVLVAGIVVLVGSWRMATGGPGPAVVKAVTEWRERQKLNRVMRRLDAEQSRPAPSDAMTEVHGTFPEWIAK